MPGADDYIRKPFSQRLLLERVRAVLRRAEGARTPRPRPAKQKKEALVRGKLALDPQRHECTWDGKPVRLTVTEFLILQALAQRPGFVKSRDSLMDAAYDDQVYVDDRTIDSHIKRLRKKFKVVADDFDAIETLYGVGYRYRGVSDCVPAFLRPHLAHPLLSTRWRLLVLTGGVILVQSSGRGPGRGAADRHPAAGAIVAARCRRICHRSENPHSEGGRSRATAAPADRAHAGFAHGFICQDGQLAVDTRDLLAAQHRARCANCRRWTTGASFKEW